MRKLDLNMDDLTVESFVTGEASGHGTVRGNQTGALEPTCAVCTQGTDENTCAGGGGNTIYCPSVGTCEAGCTNSPFHTCYASCGQFSCDTCYRVPSCVATCVPTMCYRTGCANTYCC